jgi:hypothetical protein
MAEDAVQRDVATARLGVGALRPGTLQVTLAEGVSNDELHKLIDRIIDLNGCRGCGLGGIDLRIRIVDPFILERFADINAVRDVTIVR